MPKPPKSIRERVHDTEARAVELEQRVEYLEAAMDGVVEFLNRPKPTHIPGVSQVPEPLVVLPHG